MRIIRGHAADVADVLSAPVDLVVTSPPYPMLPQWDDQFASEGAADFESMHDRLEEAWRACYRVLAPGGILAVNIGDAVRRDAHGFQLWPNHAEVLRRASRLGFVPLPYILWKKPTNRPNAFLGSGFLPPNAYVTLDCEFVLLFRRGALRRFPPHDPRRAASQFTKAERDRWFTQVWDGVRGVPQGPVGRRTAAFPVEVPRRLVRMFSLVGDTVLDPFAGTGTSLWAAAELGRNAVGIEVDPTLVHALKRRAEDYPGPVLKASPGGRSPRRRRA